MKRLLCGDCGAALTNTEIALNLKTRGRAVSFFFCLHCLGKRMGCAPQELKSLAAFFRENGCELFSRVYVDEQGSGCS